MGAYNLISTLKRDFINCHKDQGSVKNSDELLEKYLSAFIDYLAYNSVKYYEDLQTPHIQQYLSLKQKKGNRKETLDILQSIRIFCSWVRKNGNKSHHNPAKKVRLSQTVARKEIVISKRALDEIAMSCGDDTIGLRDRAIIFLLSDVGMKSVELCQLKREDYSSSTLIIRPTHSYVGRTITVSDCTAQAVERYLHASKHQDNQVWLFATVTGKKISHSNLRDILRTRCIDCGYYDFIRPSELWEAHIHNTFYTSELPSSLKCPIDRMPDEGAIVYRTITLEDLHEAFEMYGPRIEDP